MRSYNHTIYCSNNFKQKVKTICKATHLSPSDLVKAVFLFATPDAIKRTKDLDHSNDKERITLKENLPDEKTISRQPRVQVVLPYKLPVGIIKKSLIMAVSGKINS